MNNFIYSITLVLLPEKADVFFHPCGGLFLGHPGAGYDQCNIPDCTAAGIRVSNVPTIVDAATADTGIFLMLGAMRGFNVAMGNLRKGEFRGKKPPPLGQ